MSDIYNEKMDEKQAGDFVNRLSEQIDKLSEEEKELIVSLSDMAHDKISSKIASETHEKRSSTLLMLVVFVMFSSVLGALKMYGFNSFFEEDE